MVSFENTEIAFASKTTGALNKAYWLFKLIGNSNVVTVGKSLTEFALKINFPIKTIIKATIFKQFVGGETIEECESTINKLGQYNIGAILDYSVEGKESEQDFDNCAKETLATIQKAKNNKHIPFCVFKITGLARFALLEKVSANKTLSETEKEEFEKVKSRIYIICKSAFENNIPIFIDAEESWIQQAMDDLADEMMEQFNKTRVIVYNTFQLYRKDRLDYLKKSHEKARAKKYLLGAKLVRGAYMEKERLRAKELAYASPINDTKTDTDNLYDATLRYCIDHISSIAICAGSHNEKSSLLLVELMSKNNIPNNHPHIYFSQLFGMSDHISFNLAAAGYNVAKYVPYGPVKEVLPYLIRRAQENTSVKGQTGRELNLIIKEKKRRS
ncbi:MAG: proline dehydrogenase family protein [Bacteroidetes bacterium]|nr:proline dehydrogenase family protein [Bacteroidota bacterium]